MLFVVVRGEKDAQAGETEFCGLGMPRMAVTRAFGGKGIARPPLAK